MPDRLAAAIAGKDRAEVVRALVEDSARILRGGDVHELLRAGEVIAPGGELAVEVDDDSGSATTLRVFVCIHRSASLVGRGRIDEAVSELEQARTFARDGQSPLLGLTLLGLGEAHRIGGNASQADVAYREAIELAEAMEQPQVLVLALAGLARSVLGEDLELALSLVDRALDHPAALGQVAPLLAAGWLRLAAGERERAADHGQTAAREAGRQHDARGLAEALELQALSGPPVQALDLLREAATLWEVNEDRIGAGINAVLLARATEDPLAEARARRTLRSLGLRDDANRTAGALEAIGPLEGGQVSIRALGPFAVFRDGQPVPASEWQSQKARFALKILVGRGGRGISRDALCELLWPGQVDTGSRLSVVLSTLRSVLDPDREHPSDHYVVADRESVRLSSETVRIDASQFAAAAAEALRLARTRDPAAVEALELASAAYTGEFLEDDPYHPWAADVRDELHGLAGEVRRELVRALEVDDPERAVPWLLGLLSDDPYDESSYQRLIQILYAAGRHGEARRAHRRYLINMAEIAVPTLSFAELVG
jgi:cellulose synthase operon protein C